MLLDNENEMGDEISSEDLKLETTVESSTPEIPDKYRDKSLTDIVKMHQEAEKLIGKQAQEVGEVRKLADELIKQNLNNNQQPIKEQEPEIDFFENPQKAIHNTVDRHPDVMAARQATADFKRMQVQQKLGKEHPDYMEIAQNSDFADWVKASPVRLNLWAKADAEYDSKNFCAINVDTECVTRIGGVNLASRIVC
jgi:hypothetical protein